MSSLMPILRFKQFSNSWKLKKGVELFDSRREKGRDGIPIYSVSLKYGLVPRSSIDRKMKGDAATESNFVAKPDDIAYNTLRMWQGAMGLAAVECMISPAYTVLSPKDGVCSSFYFCLLKTSKYIHLLKSYSYGITSDKLRLYYKDFSSINLPWTSIEEQIKISSFIRSLDLKISHLDTKYVLLKKHKKSLLQNIFSKQIRFKKDDGSLFPDWKELRLEEMLIENTTLNDKLMYGKSGVLSVSGDRGVVNQIEHLGRSYSGDSLENYHVVNTGDIVYTKSPLKPNPFGIIKVNKGVPGIVSVLYAVYSCKESLSGDYLDYYFWLNDNVNKYLRPLVHKGAKNSMMISNQRVLSDSINVPSKDEQEKIVEFLRIIDWKIESTLLELEKMKEFKTSVLQRILA